MEEGTQKQAKHEGETLRKSTPSKPHEEWNAPTSMDWCRVCKKRSPVGLMFSYTCSRLCEDAWEKMSRRAKTLLSSRIEHLIDSKTGVPFESINIEDTMEGSDDEEEEGSSINTNEKKEFIQRMDSTFSRIITYNA